MTDLPTIVQILNGHTSPETAYVVGDYPYGFRLRCKIRYWLETATKGAKKGETRFVSQTTDPKAPGEVWNKPKGSTYSEKLSLMYLDENDHVHHMVLNAWTWERSPEFFDLVLATPGLHDDDRETLNSIVKLMQEALARREERRLEREAAIEAPLTIDPAQTFPKLDDPGHGWLAVATWMLAELQIAVSPYSYISRDGKTAYLEEDLDMTTFWKAFEGKFGHPPKYASHYESVSSVRPLRSFKPELCNPPIVLPEFQSTTPKTP